MASDNEKLHLVGFRVGKEHFAAPIANIQEIIRLTNIVTIPKSPMFIEGVINLRGKVIPVIDLKKRFDMGAVEVSPTAKIIVAEILKFHVGLIVDEVKEVVHSDMTNFEKTPSLVANVDQKFIKGLLKQDDKMMIVLDLENVISDEEILMLKNVAWGIWIKKISF